MLIFAYFIIESLLSFLGEAAATAETVLQLEPMTSRSEGISFTIVLKLSSGSNICLA